MYRLGWRRGAPRRAASPRVCVCACARVVVTAPPHTPTERAAPPETPDRRRRPRETRPARATHSTPAPPTTHHRAHSTAAFFRHAALTTTRYRLHAGRFLTRVILDNFDKTKKLSLPLPKKKRYSPSTPRFCACDKPPGLRESSDPTGAPRSSSRRRRFRSRVHVTAETGRARSPDPLRTWSSDSDNIE